MILVDSGVFIAAADRDEARHGDLCRGPASPS